MNYKAKWLSLLFAVVLLLSSFTVTAAATPSEVTVTGETVTAKSGDNITLDFNVTANPGCMIARFRVVYDKSVLTLQSGETENGQAFATLTPGPQLVFSNVPETNQTGKLMTLHFTVKADAAPGSYPVTLELVDAYNQAEQAVAFGITAGSVTVLSRGDLTVSAGAVSANPGGNADVALTVTNNPGTAFAKYQVSYDSSVLTLTGVDNGSVFGMMMNSAFLVFSEYPDSMKTGALATLHFTVSEDALPGDYPITLTCLEAYNGMEADVPTSVTNGKVTVNVVTRVNITWGAMEFTYEEGTWNPDTHGYEGGAWVADAADANKITVTNAGNADVKVSYSYSPVMAGITGSFTDGSNVIVSPVTVSPEETKYAWILLDGKPSTGMTDQTLGTVTVVLGGE